MPEGYLTTHVLDTARGVPADGMKVSLFETTENQPILLAEMVTNRDGRTDAPILPKAEFKCGTFELVFETGLYFDRVGVSSTPPRFLDVIPIRFGINDVESHYHVPLLVSPYGYSTYRGS